MKPRRRIVVWEVVGRSRIERVKGRLDRYESWYVYRCFNVRGELVFEAGTVEDTIAKYLYFFERGEL